jgi:hypothetical protein
MINPTSKDIGREVVYQAGAGSRAGKIKSFSKSYVWVVFDDEETPFPARPEHLEWAGSRWAK